MSTSLVGAIQEVWPDTASALLHLSDCLLTVAGILQQDIHPMQQCAEAIQIIQLHTHLQHTEPPVAAFHSQHTATEDTFQRRCSVQLYVLAKSLYHIAALQYCLAGEHELLSLEDEGWACQLQSLCDCLHAMIQHDLESSVEPVRTAFSTNASAYATPAVCGTLHC